MLLRRSARFFNRLAGLERGAIDAPRSRGRHCIQPTLPSGHLFASLGTSSRRGTRWLLALSCLLAAPGCQREVERAQASLQPSPAREVALSSQRQATEPARGSKAQLPADWRTPLALPVEGWRTVASWELDWVMLWVSHILIRHAEVTDPRVSFNLTGWSHVQPPATRSRADAEHLARQLAERVRAGESFAALARQYSEDPVTRGSGGSLGGVSASSLRPWPEVLDALTVTDLDQSSEVVETPQGFHILSLRPPPAEETVTGSRIVIGHEEAPWLELASRTGQRPQRSRADALARALEVTRRAQENPASFAQLVEEYSEHVDAERGGDFGTWSTREPSSFPLEIEALRQLERGQVSAPLDTLFGYQVLQRVADRPRERYSLAVIQLRFDSEAPASEPTSKPGTLRTARALLQTLLGQPQRFEEFQEKYCCRPVQQVIQGRDWPALERALAQLAPGQLGPEPIDYAETDYRIIKRLPLTPPRATPPIRFELP